MQTTLVELPPERAAIAQCLLIAYRRGLQLQPDQSNPSIAPLPTLNTATVPIAFDRLPKLKMTAVSQK